VRPTLEYELRNAYEACAGVRPAEASACAEREAPETRPAEIP
jgi:hypothetical protein